jgi:tetratricopeptide (TPR) repeat protein
MSNAFYQGIAWLTKKSFVYAIGGLLLGLLVGFKLANDSYRSQRAEILNAEIAQAAANPNAGGAQAGQGAIEQTRAIIEKARQNKNDFAAQMDAAKQFMDIQRPEGALEFLQQAVKLKPDDPDALTELAGANFFQEKFADAIPWARKALAKKSDSQPAKFYLAYSLILSRQNLKEAEQLLTQLEATSASAPQEAKDALAEMRNRLNEAKQGGAAKPAGKGQTTLAHGPEENSGVKR